jgi:hypothetical protein
MFPRSFVQIGVLGLLAAGSASAGTPIDQSRPLSSTEVAPIALTDAKTEFATGMDSALNGDMTSALPHFKRIDARGLNAKQQAALTGVLVNFNARVSRNGGDTLDPWTAKVLEAYQSYWSRVMMGRVTAEIGERQLAETLAPLVGVTGESGTPIEMNALEPKIQEQIRAKGYYSLQGVTSPLREFMLWRTRDDKVYNVELPDGREAVSVAMLDDFVSLGWTGFATGNYYHSGGWATRERLFCVRASYDLDSESFRISYLAHEGQHFSDYKRFPSLEGPELEYRAKLVELIYADTTARELLKAFSEQGSDKRENPHGYANRRMMSDLARALNVAVQKAAWWESIPPVTIRATALRLFNEDTQRLERGSAAANNRLQLAAPHAAAAAK